MKKKIAMLLTLNTLILSTMPVYAETRSIPVSLTVSGQYTVELPRNLLIVPDENGLISQDVEVKVNYNISPSENLYIKPKTSSISFHETGNGKEDITGTYSTDLDVKDSRYNYNTNCFEGGVLPQLEASVKIGHVSTDTPLSAGLWTGSLEFDIECKEAE